MTYSIFSAVNPYSSWVRSTGPKGSLPFFKKNHGLGTDQDLNVGRDAYDAHAPGYWPLAGPSLSTPHFKKVPEAVVDPVGGPTFELLGLNGPWERFQLRILPYLWRFSAHRMGRTVIWCVL